MIRQNLHIANRAIAAAIVAELFVVAAALIVATRKVEGRKLMLTGLAATPAGMALLVFAEPTGSLPILLVGTAVCAITGAFGYRGGLAVVNTLAPAERRAEMASAFFICCFCGNALPIVGLGALGQAISARAADLVFAIVVAAIAGLAGIAALVRDRRR